MYFLVIDEPATHNLIVDRLPRVQMSSVERAGQLFEKSIWAL